MTLIVIKVSCASSLALTLFSILMCAKLSERMGHFRIDHILVRKGTSVERAMFDLDPGGVVSQGL